jgi:hypothetical protein
VGFRGLPWTSVAEIVFFALYRGGVCKWLESSGLKPEYDGKNAKNGVGVKSHEAQLQGVICNG